MPTISYSGICVPHNAILSDIRVLGAERVLLDRQGPLVERLGVGVAALGTVQPGEVVEARCDVGVLGAEGLLHDRQRALIERLGLGVAALVATKRETLELVRAYYSISDPEVREKIRKLVQAAAKMGLSPDTGRKPVRRKPKAAPKKPTAKQRTNVQAKSTAKKATTKGSRRASPAQATEFDRSKIDGRTKVGKAALAALKKRGRKSKTDLEALAAVGYPGAAAMLRAARKPQTKPKGTSKRKAR